VLGFCAGILCWNFVLISAETTGPSCTCRDARVNLRRVVFARDVDGERPLDSATVIPYRRMITGNPGKERKGKSLVSTRHFHGENMPRRARGWQLFACQLDWPALAYHHLLKGELGCIQPFDELRNLVRR
jgi:hypothetical protein